MALPDAVQYGQVKWHVVSAAADTADVDALPDAVPVTGTVTFTPSATVLLATGGAPVTVIGTAVTYNLDTEGVLRDAQARDLISLVATDSADITPTGWTWGVSYRLNGGLSRGSFSFALPAGTVVDLTNVAPVGSSGGAQIVQGPPGPVGGSLPVVIHGSDANTPRPDVDAPVIWFGSVDPVNSDPALDVWVPVTSSEG